MTKSDGQQEEHHKNTTAMLQTALMLLIGLGNDTDGERSYREARICASPAGYFLPRNERDVLNVSKHIGNGIHAHTAVYLRGDECLGYNDFATLMGIYGIQSPTPLEVGWKCPGPDSRGCRRQQTNGDKEPYNEMIADKDNPFLVLLLTRTFWLTRTFLESEGCLPSTTSLVITTRKPKQQHTIQRQQPQLFEHNIPSNAHDYNNPTNHRNCNKDNKNNKRQQKLNKSS